jgi:hypothetical protein
MRTTTEEGVVSPSAKVLHGYMLVDAATRREDEPMRGDAHWHAAENLEIGIQTLLGQPDQVRLIIEAAWLLVSIGLPMAVNASMGSMLIPIKA